MDLLEEHNTQSFSTHFNGGPFYDVFFNPINLRSRSDNSWYIVDQGYTYLGPRTVVFNFNPNLMSTNNNINLDGTMNVLA
jgi:hypothetical protein